VNQADHEPCYNARVPSLLYETAAFPSGVKEATTVFDRYDPNGIQLGSKCVLYQGLAQQTSWFAHKREGFGPPLFDSGLDAVRTYGIDEQELQRHAGVRGPEPP
jgi:hypothetical protein